MQDLRFLRTNLSEEFSVVIMEKHLLHLDKITITNCCGHPFKNAKQLQMEQLFARVLSARCGCKIKTTESWRKWF
ncbi:unnamed protein product [Allacma fusca]|uniref:Uncharacterized protein n=1 Tax=Allacma fusca TaxID=39272 RepID=A0A8J2PE75_9HEXA|nr:unnamed protein product [Allacma fusca]